jgi:hypothetical protein
MSTTKAEKIDTISAKFCRAWIACKNPELDGVNPFFSHEGKPFKYSTLRATLAEIRKVCTAEDICYRQEVTEENGQYIVKSSVMDENGEAMTISTFPIDRCNTPQAFGSALTYTKRQQAQADWGITGEPDDDANIASGVTGQPRQQPKAQPKQQPARPVQQALKESKRKAMLARVVELTAKCIEAGVKAESFSEYLQATYKVAEPSQLTDEALIAYGKHVSSILESTKKVKEGK